LLEDQSLELAASGLEEALPRHRFGVEELGSHGPECRRGDGRSATARPSRGREPHPGRRRSSELPTSEDAEGSSTVNRGEVDEVDELGSAGSGTMSGMEDIQAQIQALQTSVRRQRFAIVGLASLLAGSVLLGAVSPAGDATFDTITCKKWRVVDKDGNARISASTLAAGDASVIWLDKDGKIRIYASTDAVGDASVALADKAEKVRISASTLAAGHASVNWYDKDGKPRIVASTLADGIAGVNWSDKDGKIRFYASTLADGSVLLPTRDLVGK
jgi:hypothetical protein